MNGKKPLRRAQNAVSMLREQTASQL